MTNEIYDPEKFKNFDRLLQENKGVDHVLIHYPEVLGDNYTEMVTNLNKLATAVKATSAGFQEDMIIDLTIS